MNLIYLHGAPATGKLTIARELVQLAGGRILDNHASIDFAKTVFDFDTPEFWRLVQAVRLLTIEQAAESSLTALITTACYADPVDRPHFEKVVSLVEGRGGAVWPVYLHCDTQTLHARVVDEERRARGKLSSVAGLDEFLAKCNIAPVAHANCFSIDTGQGTALETAERIACHLDAARGRIG